jgi:hypothetical protein
VNEDDCITPLHNNNRPGTADGVPIVHIPWMDLPRVIVLDLAGQLEGDVVLVSRRLGKLSRPGDATPSSQLLLLLLLLLQRVRFSVDHRGKILWAYARALLGRKILSALCQGSGGKPG